MSFRRRPYRSPVPLRPKSANQSRIVNRMDEHDSGFSVAQQLQAAGFRARDGHPSTFQNLLDMGTISPGMRDYEPKTRAQIDASKKTTKERLFQAYHWWNQQLNYTAVYGAIQLILQNTFSRVISRGESWIDMHVPKATGQLRTSLKKQLRAINNLQDGGTRLNLRLGSYVHYLKYVAEMTPANSRLQHNPPEERWVYYYGPRRKVVLDDSQAKHFFFMRYILFMRKVIREELARSIMNVSNQMQVPQYYFRQEMYVEDKN